METTAALPGRPRDPTVDRRIAQAALELFADSGWAGFAMEAVARRAGVGKASVYLRWSSKQRLLADAVTMRLALVTDVDTGSLRGDLVRLAAQMLEIYGAHRRAALRLVLEADAIPGVAEHYETMLAAQRAAARAILRRGVARGEAPAGASVSLLLETLAGGAMMHAASAPAGNPAGHARRLAGFLLNAIQDGAS